MSLEEKCFAVDEALDNLTECVADTEAFDSAAQQRLYDRYKDLCKALADRDEV